ncbi:MAG: DUF6262 family protein [Anaerocolumna aminovalerica]|uniref:DUF6262 family protein n=1 Tax=Anaerocolumna aminovalerica TaxID=1527 RepID=UPI0029140042|nr:DUF6262 family protein [Anaerocolumna aminovalerica]MDU6266805.1 DUF6262 family protein [Anaerocolumna aminovalerica]
MSNTDKIVSMKKEESAKKEKFVLDTINRMALEHKKITFTTVYKEAGVSKPYVYKNDNIRNAIAHYMENPVHSVKTQDSKDVIIYMQKEKIKELEHKINKLQREIETDSKYRQKYEKALKENKELKRQLERAYQY